MIAAVAVVFVVLVTVPADVTVPALVVPVLAVAIVPAVFVPVRPALLTGLFR